MRTEAVERRMVWKLREKEARAKFEERVEELVSVDTPDMWSSFKEGVLKACEEVCGKKKGRRDRGDTWWWNEEVKEVIGKKKEAYKIWCKDRSEGNKARYKSMKNRAKKVVAKAMRKEAEEELSKISENPNTVFQDGEDDEERRKGCRWREMHAGK